MTDFTNLKMRQAYKEYFAYFSRTCPDLKPMTWEHWEAANIEDFTDTDGLEDPNYVGGRDHY